MSAPTVVPIYRSGFRWQDGERLVLYGRGKLGEASNVLGDRYEALTTSRARGAAPAVLERASAIHEVPEGHVDELAAGLRSEVRGERLVALGGGRVIDVAKALAAADPPRTVAAIPSTLSGAEMTGGHRHASGVPSQTPHVRPAIVLNDPELSASQPREQLAASALNAMGHAAEGPLTLSSNPVAALAALQASRLLAAGLLGHSEEPDRDALALGSLLAGYVIDSTGYGLHHILSQTLVRLAGIGHGTANAIMLEHSLRALASRGEQWMQALAEALGDPAPEVARRLCAISGLTRLRDAGVEESLLDRCADAAAERPELQAIPPAPDRREIRAVYDAAY